jgi:phosphomannomutase
LTIKFGSDGFRGIIGSEYTYGAVARITQAAAAYVLEQAGPSTVVPVGYDTRFLSYEQALRACGLLQQAGLRPQLLDGPTPSPYVSFAAHHTGAPVALQFTASHNPYYYNGVKLKAAYGGSVVDAVARQIEARANELDSVPDALTTGTTERFDFSVAYSDRMAELGEAGIAAPLIVDYMHGAASRLYGQVLRQHHSVRETLREGTDPLFGGGKPEPLAPLLGGLTERVRTAGQGTVGLAFDGDGDRLAVIDEAGDFLQSHEIFALLLDHLARNGAMGKRVVTTVSFSSLLARIAASHGLAVTEVPVGFKHVSAEMLNGDVLIGGEESGGAALGHYLPERDALLMALTLLQARARVGSLHELLADIYARFGRSEFVRDDVELEPGQAAHFRARLPELLGLGTLAGEGVVSTSDRDGVKLRTAMGWVLVRASGTEPLARFYAEAPEERQAQAYVRAVREWLEA